MKIQLRRDTQANWADADPILAAGEPGFDVSTMSLKIGDGVTSWSLLTAINNLRIDGGNAGVYNAPPTTGPAPGSTEFVFAGPTPTNFTNFVF